MIETSINYNFFLFCFITVLSGTMFSSFVINNAKDHSLTVIIGLTMIFVLLIAGLEVMYAQGIESFGVEQENKSSVASKTSLKYTHPPTGSLLNKGSQNKSSAITKHVAASNSNYASARNISRNNTSTPITVNTNQNPWFLVVQFIVSGLVAGTALFIANIALDKYRSPHLLIDKEDFLKPTVIDIRLYEIDIPGFSRELRYFNVPYVVNRVIIKNDGKSAAEGCKGVLKINNTEEKICWYVPSERYKMTINVDSSEYLDICAMLCGDAKDIHDRLKKRIELFGDEKNGGAEARKIISNLYQTYEDIPVLIAPTENGWQPAKSNRRIHPGNATIIVTAKNTKPSLRLDIKILDRTLDGGKLIQLRDRCK